MFWRMLKLPKEIREKYRRVIARGAPRRPRRALSRSSIEMIDWWGPILLEYYTATELLGFAMCDSQQWLSIGTVVRYKRGRYSVLDDEECGRPPKG